MVKTLLMPRKISEKVFCVAGLLRNEAVLVLLLQMLLHQCRMIWNIKPSFELYISSFILWTKFVITALC